MLEICRKQGKKIGCQKGVHERRDKRSRGFLKLTVVHLYMTYYQDSISKGSLFCYGTTIF